MVFDNYHKRKSKKFDQIADKTKSKISAVSNFFLERILLRDKQISSSKNPKRSENNISNVKRILEVHSCIEALFPLIEQNCQFDLLDQAILDNFVNVKRK